MRELAHSYQLDKRTIKKHLDSFKEAEKTHTPRPIYLVVDTIYFGPRPGNWGMTVFRDPHKKENLYWTVCDHESTTIYLEGRRHLESLGYTILSVTGDGFGGISQAFSGIPYQMCHVHMERIVVRHVTQNPQTEAGQVLLALTRTLHEETGHKTFKQRLASYIERYRDFLNEKTYHPNGSWSHTHKGVRTATKSLQKFLPHLFTYQTNEYIARTTNSLEGHFRHVREITATHCGLSRHNKVRMLSSIFKASTIAPKEL